MRTLAAESRLWLAHEARWGAINYPRSPERVNHHEAAEYPIQGGHEGYFSPFPGEESYD